MAEASVVYEKVCIAGFLAVGLQPWERVQSVFRIVCTLITVSIVSAWVSRKGIGRLILLFLHWVGGLVHLLAGVAMAQMMLNCWISDDLLSLIKALKFLELAGSNLVAVTNLVICVNLGLIVHHHRTMSRMGNVSSFPMVCFIVVISLAGAALSMPFWERMLLSGASFHVGASGEADNDWVATSYFLLEAIAGAVMTIIVVLLLLLRRTELKQVWALHRRIKYHVALTAIAMMVNIVIAVAGVMSIVNDGPLTLIVISWILRYVHIALDTLVLYSALETPVFHLGSSDYDFTPTSYPYTLNGLRY